MFIQFGNTPLHIASFYGKSDVIITLLAAGAEKDAVNLVSLI